MAKTRAKAKVFLDSSVVIAAMLSTSGGSFRICRESHEGNLHLYTNTYVRDEVHEVLGRKYPWMVLRIEFFFRWAKFSLQKNPTVATVRHYATLIHPEDAPILAGAAKAKVHALVTLDRRDFFTEKLNAVKFPFRIMLPKEFFERYTV